MNRASPSGGRSRPVHALVCIAGAMLCTLLAVLPAGAQPTIVEPGWTLIRTVELSGAMSAKYDPVDGLLYAGRRGSGADGLYRIDRLGYAVQLAGGSNIAAVVVHPDSGHVYVSEDYGGIIYRTAFGAAGRQTWVSGFHSGDDDPIGMAIAPPDYSGPVLSPGEALVVDRGNSGPDEVWRWDPLTAEGEVLVYADDGLFVDLTDVAIDATQIFLVDTGLTAAGTIYELIDVDSVAVFATSEPLADPSGIVIDPVTGDLLVYDHGDLRVVRIDRATGSVGTMLSGLGSGVGWSGLDVTPDARRLVVTQVGAGRIDVFARCDAAGEPDLDCDGNGIYDLCDIALGVHDDCNGNDVPDSCDIALGTSDDCNEDGVPDDCPVCPPVEVVFIMDTSTSMDDEATALCGSTTQVVAQLEAAGLSVSSLILGICDQPGGAYACLENDIVSLLGTAVPGDPPPGLETLGACPGGLEVCQEDWGLATAVVAGEYPWSPTGESVRLIIPLSDEGSWCGDPVTTEDQAAVDHAIAVARARGVIVSPITGSGSSTAVTALAQALADSTGGQHFGSSTPSADIAQAIVDLVLAACFAASDCNDNGVLDECDIGAGTSQDQNGNGIPDECEATGVPVPERLPAGLRLEQNHPNPFNPLTEISFALPRAATVDLAVFALDGRRIAILAAGRMPAGEHRAIWNGRDGTGRAVASGTYVCRLEAGGRVATVRMVLLK